MKNLQRRDFIKISSLAGLQLAAFNGYSAFRSNTANTGINDFIKPPEIARSGCYWWWFNGLLNKEGITRDLEAFKDKGIGNVLIINTKGGLGGAQFPEGAKLFSPEWRELFRHALREATRLKIEVGMNLSSGWCMGGPWIPPQHAGRWMLQSKIAIDGPRKFSEALPLPGGRDGYDNVFNPPGYKEYLNLPIEKLDYRDTLIVAVPDKYGYQSRLRDERGGASLSAKTNRKDISNQAKAREVIAPVIAAWKEHPDDMAIKQEEVIDLTDKVNAEGILNWDVPPGHWTVIRTGHRMTGSGLLIAQPEADGLSVDWFAPEGVDLQFENFAKIILEEAKAVPANTLKYFHDDSFEDGFPNWTEKILARFEHYRGYDPRPYIPVFAGFIIGSATISDRFLSDYRKTIADCMADLHYGRFATLTHQHNLKMQNEAAGPSRSGSISMNGLKNLGYSDYPMGEFWLGTDPEDQSTLADTMPYGISRLDDGQNKVTKMTASAAHTYGRNTASAEAFTSFRHWKDCPRTIKQALDRALCEGINRIFIHTCTATRPEDGKPGYEYGAGTHFNPNVTWWEFSGAFLTYVARCQYLLRSGKFVADVLYYNGDVTPNLVDQKMIYPDLGPGYDYDVCNEDVLLTRLSVKNGNIVLPDGMSYRVLVLPDYDQMPVPVLKKIQELVKNGATVVGKPPIADSGLKNYPDCDKEISAIAEVVWGDIAAKTGKRNYGKGSIINGIPVREVLLNEAVLPDFEYKSRDDKKVWIDFIHRSAPDNEIYFITNRLKEKAFTQCTFRVKNRQPQLWDAVTGAMLAPGFKTVNGRVVIDIDLDIFQSVFVVFPIKRERLKSADYWFQKTERIIPKGEIAGPWKVRFDTKWGGPEQVTFNKLEDWSTNTDERIKYFSGKAVYQKTFDLPDAISPDAVSFIDLGTVRDICRVWLNGQDLGIVWTNPWRVAISGVVKKQNNRLKIEVINMWPNRLIGDAALPKEKRLTNTNIVFKATDKLLPSGLLGPVTLLSGEDI